MKPLPGDSGGCRLGSLWEQGDAFPCSCPHVPWLWNLFSRFRLDLETGGQALRAGAGRRHCAGSVITAKLRKG